MYSSSKPAGLYHSGQEVLNFSTAGSQFNGSLTDFDDDTKLLHNPSDWSLHARRIQAFGELKSYRSISFITYRKRVDKRVDKLRSSVGG